MSDFVQPLLESINANPEWANVATFLISAAESVAIIGTIVPGSITMTAIGALAGAGIIPLWQTIFLAILGAIFGDGISYWIGHHFKDRLPTLWPFRNHPNFLKTGEKFFHKHGGTSVFIGRFVGPVRALVPLVAGMLGMQPLRFFIANILSAIGWAPAYMLPGILLGAASLELPPDIALHVALVLLFIVLLALLIAWFVYQLLKLNLMLYAYLTSTLFIILACYIRMHGSESLFANDACLHFFRGIRTHTLDVIALHITSLGESSVVLPTTLFFVLGLCCLKRYITALYAAGLLFATYLLGHYLKPLIHSVRPTGILHQLPSFSMPSGHTTIATVAYLGLAVLFARSAPKWKKLIYPVAVLTIFLVGLSRLYLTAHWLTDVLGGWLLGASLLIFTARLFARHEEAPPAILALLLIAFLPLSISMTYFHEKHFNAFMTNYTKIPPSATHITLQAWWQQDESFPTYRSSLFGFPSTPMNIEWHGSLKQIQHTLKKAGWVTPPARDWMSVLHRLTDVQSNQYLPMISPQFLDEKPVIVLVRYIHHVDHQPQLWVLRLWNSNLLVDHKTTTIWVGTIGEVPRTFSWLFKNHAPQTTPLAPALFFNQTQPMPWQFKIIKKYKTLKNGQTIERPTILITQEK